MHAEKISSLFCICIVHELKCCLQYKPEIPLANCRLTVFKSSSFFKVPDGISHIPLNIKYIEKNEKLNGSYLPIIRKCWGKEGMGGFCFSM